MLQATHLNSSDEGPIQLTHEEIHKFEEAFKNPEFRDLFRSYMEDISSPETRKQYEAQIAELERERGNTIRWVRPTGHFAFQTRLLEEQQKPPCLTTNAFKGIDTDVVIVNIATSPEIQPPVSKRSSSGGVQGALWTIPHSVTPPRPGVLDGNGDTVCTIIDVVYHPEVVQKQALESTLISTAIESIATKLSVKLSPSFSKLETQKYVGAPINTVIREQTQRSTSTSKTDLQDPRALVSTHIHTQQSNEETCVLEEPRHTVTHQHKVNMQDFATDVSSSGFSHSHRPTALVVRFELPKVSNVEAIDVDVHEKSIVLNVPRIYHCVVSLPYSVDSDGSSAKWIAGKFVLELNCPVVLSS